MLGDKLKKIFSKKQEEDENEETNGIMVNNEGTVGNSCW